MLTKTNFVCYLSLITTLFFTACQKETIKEVGTVVVDPPITSDTIRFAETMQDAKTLTVFPSVTSSTSHFEGNFYGSIYTSRIMLPPDDFNNQADQVVKVYVENDTIKVLNYAFPIDSLSQTHFDASVIPNPNSYSNTKILKLTYSNNYNRIVIEYDYDCYYGPYNGCANSELDFNGLRTTKNETVLPHGDVANLTGTYRLWVRKQDFTNNLDTQYIKNVVVTTSGNSFFFDQQRFSLDLFDSYQNYTSLYIYSYYRREVSRNIYWHNDSLSLQYSKIINDASIGYSSSVRYTYRGRKE
ncbi:MULTISPECIES: hypothetical protein [unclassified Aureispira]|uniref:hypothetical protein n=1 Tax=unclassified Aureispira TaxID=2649989 RepID=UPI000696ABB2|nr:MULTISPECIES: hypothetical protein [unclassified Aureispira]WMX16983.1 hypothetical protein QP953_11430 [Aureispira sp. CCB-E]